MSFRTDGFEPSAYTIPPPPAWGMINQPATRRRADHSATAAGRPVDPMRPTCSKHLAKVST